MNYSIHTLQRVFQTPAADQISEDRLGFGRKIAIIFSAQQAAHALPAGAQLVNEMAPDKPRTSGNQNHVDDLIY
jgi:hypothetical protein